MKINFLTGDLALRENKTGVHLYHDHIITQCTAVPPVDDECLVSVFHDRAQAAELYPSYPAAPYASKLVFSHKYSRLLAYLLPIEWFFGASDVYVCDGLIPRTTHASVKIAVVHDLMVKVCPENYSFLKRTYLNLYLRRLRKADCIVAVSETTKTDVNRFLHVPLERIRVVPNGPNVAISPDLDMAEASARLDLGRKYLFYIGDMRKNKNLCTALEAYAECAKGDPDLCFYIAGPKKCEYENLQAFVDEHGLGERVRFLGYVTDEDKEALYRAAHALVFISDYEGFGVPILEGAVCSIPVITSNRSSMREIAEGRSILVDPHDVDDVAAAIRALDDTGYRESVVAAQQELVRRYTWEHSGELFLKVLSECGGRRGDGGDV